MGFRFLIKWLNLNKILKVSVFIWVWIFICGEISSVLGSDFEKFEKLTLLELKSSVLDMSGLLSSWVLSRNLTEHCKWDGVVCDSKFRVVGLNISGGSDSCVKIGELKLYGFGIRRECLGRKGKIEGSLPLAIAKLSELKVLSLPYNELSGVIPIEILNMGKLEVIDLEGNKVSGVWADGFVGLRNLRVLNLGFNDIEGVIPGSLRNCGALEILNLAGNKVNGSIPGFVGGFKDLRGLYLSFNQLSGSIPKQIGDNCGKLEFLELSGNFLNEGIPRSLGNCKGLRSLQLFSNMLEGVIPSDLGQLNQLEVLDVSRNSLGGAIPSELSNCSKLSILVLSNLWDPLPITSSQEDEYNFYDGSIPAGIRRLDSLRMLWAPRATLEGNLPTDWGACNNLEVVNLGQNYFTGGISEGFSHCRRLRFLNLSSNNLTGELVKQLPVPCMTVFDISGNNFSGWIPEFHYNSCVGISSLKAVEFYDPSAAYIYFYTRKTQALVPLPSFDVEDAHAVFHNFGDNSFTGTLPVMPIAPIMSAEKIVYAFLVGRNKLKVSFPGNLFRKCNYVSSMLIDISYNGLTGPLPPDIASRCQCLTYLDASGNHITGSIPSNFGSVSSPIVVNLSSNQLQGLMPGSLTNHRNLKSLSLSGNNLTGTIPVNLGQLRSLEVLDLSYNSLSGEIPRNLTNLKNLLVLLLNNNKLSGPIPSELANMTTITRFNVSFNNLSGPLPQNGNMMKCSSFLGNPFLKSCNVYSLTSPRSDQQGSIENAESYAASPSTTPTHKGSNNGLTSLEIASIISASAIVSVLIALICLFFYTRKLNPKSRVSGSIRKELTVFTDIGVPLTFDNVVSATGYFNASNCIGSGGFGATYKAEIEPGVLVAIKRLAVGRFHGDQHNQFDAEIKTLGRLRHPNLVTLIGYHASETETFLIYNYMPGGNLEKFIQQRSTRVVDWRVLHKIASDIACALSYLHDQCVPRVLHRDVKPSNILLDENHNAYLSDFGLARLIGTSETHATTNVAGTFGYVAPEYAMTCRVSDKADVYSYGVVLLELISDKKALDPSFSSYGNGFNIVAWANLLWQGRDQEFFSAGLWDAGPQDDLVNVLHLGIVCTDESLLNRPTMKQVVRRLKQLQPPSQ